MRIAFVHRAVGEYTVETPYRRAVGGTEAAVSYLCVELVKLGHSVTLAGNTSQPGRYLGVQCLNYRSALTSEFFDAADAVVVVNEALGRKLRELGVTKPLVLWTGHAKDQPSMQPLEFARERKAWTGFAFVSEWQREDYISAFWLPRDRAHVLRNAAAPAVATKAPAAPWFERDAAPILAYTSAPYRGLDVLLAAFPVIRAAVPDATLRVFSGARDEYPDLYRQCTAMQGVEYVGPVSQPVLAEALAQAAALVYPSTFAETSCIAAMEAMALGLAVITTSLGALPETLAGFGHMARRNSSPAEFAAMTIAVLREMKQSPQQAIAKRSAQMAFAREKYSWVSRALEWQNWLSELARNQS